MHSFGEIVLWLVPYLLGGFVSMMGVLVMLSRGYESDSGWVLRGIPAVLLGVLALPVLPLVVLINPSLAERAALREEKATAERQGEERRARLAALKERRQALAGELAEMDKDKPVSTDKIAPRLSPLEANRLQDERLAEQLSASKKWRARRQPLEDEEHQLAREESTLRQEETRAVVKGYEAKWERSADRAAFLLPFAWGGALYGLAWLCGRKEKAAKAEEPQWTNPAAVPSNSSSEPGPQQQ